MNLVILGPPGAGKGTQAARLSEVFSLRHLSSGDVLRAERKKGSALGGRVAKYMDAGELVPDGIIVEVILTQLQDSGGSKGVLLDGFPRTRAQATSLDKVLSGASRRVDLVLSLTVPDELIVDRITGRRICPTCDAVYHVRALPPAERGVCDHDGTPLIHRTDDTEAVVKQRLTAYYEQTSPLEAYYREKGILVEVDGTKDVDGVLEALSAAIRSRLG